MRLLHTSDWHLGVSAGAVSRGPEHQAFLDWLLETLESEEVDALVVAGDIFDSFQPTSEAMGRYYRFLARVAATGTPQVLLVGGNHDSAPRLEAPSELLEALDIRVVGAVSADDAEDRAVVDLRARGGDVGAVALAVPYVHEFHLGIRTTDPDHAEVRRRFVEAFKALYSRLADRARERRPDLPMVATGHLTMGRALPDDSPRIIHRIGDIGALPLEVMDRRIQYAALGHIHRALPVEKGRAWYSGSPVALGSSEATVGRRVLLVDLDPDPQGEPVVTPVQVPTLRAIREIRGSHEEVLAMVREQEWQEPLPPLLYCRAVADRFVPGFHEQIAAALDCFSPPERPLLAEARQERVAPLQLEAEDSVSLEEMSPLEVFETLCQVRGEKDVDALRAAFQVLHEVEDDETFEAMVDQVKREGR